LIKVIVAGGRDFNDYPLLCAKLDLYLSNLKGIQIISGNAKGADYLGEKYAIEHGHKLRLFPAPWGDIEDKPEREIGIGKDGRKYWKLAGPARNRQMAEFSVGGYCVVFWDGKSTGSANMIEVAKEFKLPTKIVRYDQQLRTNQTVLGL